MRHRALIAAVAAVLCVPLFAAAGSTAPLGKFALTVPAGGFEERCVDLAAGVEVRYRFSATEPVDFNIHHHRGAEVFYPVRTDATRGADARFRAPAADAYCLMWERKGAGAVRVEGSVERVSR
jgi:hypothetical protein